MILHDLVYSKIEVRDRLITELIESRALQRLKGINQHGSWRYLLGNDNVTRFDHCVGVYYLLRHFGASLEEQAAGIIHDVPHTAFSHVIDYVYGQRESMEHHEALQEGVVMNSDVPGIVKAHGFDIKRMLDYRNFPLLERPLPDLCCDRLDYFFRDALFLGVCTREEINSFMEQLAVRDNEIVCTEPDVAKGMALAFLKCSETLWASPLQAASYELLARAVKAGLRKGLLREEELLLTDDDVYARLEGSGDREVLANLSLVRPGLRVENNPRDFDFITGTKARFIDPKTATPGGLRRVSDIYPDFRDKAREFRERIGQGYHIKILTPGNNFNNKS